jgi:hypothetical protein
MYDSIPQPMFNQSNNVVYNNIDQSISDNYFNVTTTEQHPSNYNIQNNWQQSNLQFVFVFVFKFYFETNFNFFIDSRRQINDQLSIL